MFLNMFENSVNVELVFNNILFYSDNGSGKSKAVHKRFGQTSYMWFLTCNFWLVKNLSHLWRTGTNFSPRCEKMVPIHYTWLWRIVGTNFSRIKKVKKKKKTKKKQQQKTKTKKRKNPQKNWCGMSVDCKADLLVAGVPSRSTRVIYIFREDLVMKIFLRPFFLFLWFKKSSYQLMAKECSLSTGKNGGFLRNIVVLSTDRPDTTLIVDRGRKTSNDTNKAKNTQKKTTTKTKE